MTEYRAKDTFFSKNHTLNFRGKLLNLSTPRIMGILNITNDSFYDGGKYDTPEKAIDRVRQMVFEGADIIDVGAASSRPGAAITSSVNEISALSPVLHLIRQEFPELIISLDTYHSDVAAEMIEKFGVNMINDISAGEIDPRMFSVIKKYSIPYLIMHMQGVPGNMQENPAYQNITDDIIQYFSARINELRKKGIVDVIIDPGFGFGKSRDHNYELLSHTEAFQMFEIAVAAGISRKSMIYDLLGSSSDESLNGTTAVHMILLQKGVQLLRVHDVKEAKEAVKIFMETCRMTGGQV